MFTKNLKDQFSASLLAAASSILDEAKKKKCSEKEEKGENEKAEMEESSAEYGKSIDNEKKKNISASDKRKIAKIADMMKKANEEVEQIDEISGKTLTSYSNKVANYGPMKDARTREKHEKGVYTAYKKMKAKDVKVPARMESIDKGLEDELMSQRQGVSGKKWRVERMGKTISTHNSKDMADVKAMRHPLNRVKANEEVEQIDEISAGLAARAGDKADERTRALANKRKRGAAPSPLENKLRKQTRKFDNYADKKQGYTTEEAEQIDELSKEEQDFIDSLNNEMFAEIDRVEEANLTGLPKSTAEKNQQYIEITHLLGHKRRVPVHPTNAYKALNRYRKDPSTKSARIVSEEVELETEDLHELSKDTLGRYIYKAANQVGEKGITAGLKIGDSEDSKKEFKTMGKRQKGIAKAVSKLTKEDQEFIDSLNNDLFDEITLSELSNDTLKSYVGKAQKSYDKSAKQDERAQRAGDRAVKKHGEFSQQADDAYAKAAQPQRNMEKRYAGLKMAAKKIKEEADTLDEARGRPKKAGAKDFTIHPKTKEKLMHNNPEHMKRIEALHKTGALVKPKVEANQHIMTQLQRAKTSMRGGETIHFTHGDSKEVSGAHAAKILDKYAGMKPSEKEAFQKKVSHSHAELMKHV